MASQEEVKLLGFWISPFVLRVERALMLKGVEYEYIEEEQLLFNKSPLLLKMNPIHKTVPVLIHKGKPIAESCIIMEYIDEIWKQSPLLPQDPYERAEARFWAKVGDEKFAESAFKVLISEGEEQDRAVETAIEILEKIEEKFQGKKWFGGEQIGYLDLVFGWISYMLPVWEEIASRTIVDPSKFPAITSWSSNFLSHPIVKDKVPAKDKMIPYFEDLIKSRLASMASGKSQ